MAETVAASYAALESRPIGDTSPPEELWRRPVGPSARGSARSRSGSSRSSPRSKRADQEMVWSYLLATGEPVWRHADPVRFWDSHAGAGPRATPMVPGDRLYTLGGKGLLTALDAQPGRRLVGTRRHHRTRRDLVGMGLRRLAAGGRPGRGAGGTDVVAQLDAGGADVVAQFGAGGADLLAGRAEFVLDVADAAAERGSEESGEGTTR